MIKDNNFRIVIISRGRSKTIESHKLFPYADLIVPEEEREEYKKAVSNNLVTTPNNIIGLGILRNWVLDNYKEECIVMVDDDIKALYYIGGVNAKRIENADTIEAVIYNAYIMASDINLGFFGFNQAWDVRKYKADSPIVLNSWAGGVVGIIGRELKFCKNKFKVDIDFALQNLLHKRIVIIDSRYSFAQARDRNKGGNSKYRTKEGVENEIAYLKNKWGKHFKIKKTKTTYQTILDVKRKNAN